MSCPYCKQIQTHRSDCKIDQISQLRFSNLHLSCPECGENISVGLNKDGNHECRRCNTQFTKDSPVDSLGTKYLYDINGNGLLLSILPTLGNGDFPIDSEIDKLVFEMREQGIEI